MPGVTAPPSARQQATTQLLAEIQTLRQGEETSYGSPRMTEELQARGYACSENRIARLMRQHGLRVQARPRFVPCTTNSDHDLPIAPRPPNPIKSGCKTSPMCQRPEVGCIWRWSWICGVARSSAGRWLATCAANWRSAHCKWLAPNAAPLKACWCIPIAACNTQPRNSCVFRTTRLGGQHETQRQSL